MPKTNRSSTMTYTDKLSAAAASLGALYLAPGTAQAVVMAGSGGPLTVTAGTGAAVDRDIDGDGNHDFILWTNETNGTNTIHLGSAVGGGFSQLAGPTPNGRGIVNSSGPAGRPLRLATSFMVGPTLASGYGFNDTQVAFHAILYRNVTDAYASNNFEEGDNLLGLRFEIGGADHFAWANIVVDLDAETVTVAEWYWETAADTAIHVGDRGPVPEPGMAGLTLLGLGAIGLSAWRRRKAAAAA